MEIGARCDGARILGLSVACLLAAASAACSSDAATRRDGGTNRPTDPLLPSCERPLDSIRACPPTLDELRQRWLSMLHNPSALHQGACGPYQVFLAVSEGGFECIYDRSGTQLLAALSCNDIKTNCDGGGFCEFGGPDIDIQAYCDPAALPALR